MTISLSAGASSYDEGSTAIFYLKNAVPNTSYASYLTGPKFPSDEVGYFSSLRKFIYTDPSGNATISVPLYNDYKTDGQETLTLVLNLREFGEMTASTILNDTSTALPIPPVKVPEPNVPIKLQGSKASVKEGSTFAIYITVDNLVSNDEVYILPYTLSGIDAKDISRVFIMGAGSNDQLTNTFSGEIGIGKAMGLRAIGVFSFLVRSDSLTEGPETLIFSAGGQSISIVIDDTSTGSAAAPIVPEKTIPVTNQIVVTAEKKIVTNTPENDLILGSDGVDTVSYQRVASNFKISTNFNNEVIAVDSMLAQNGGDRLINIERLQFTDTMLALDTGTNQSAGSGYMLYKAAFNRIPDAGGLGYWINKMDTGMGYNAVAQNFVNSAEFKTAFGGSNPTVNTLVTKLYNNVLARAPDAGGLAFWQDKISNGGWSTADVLGYFAISNENIMNVTPLIANGIQYQQFVG